MGLFKKSPKLNKDIKSSKTEEKSSGAEEKSTEFQPDDIFKQFETEETRNQESQRDATSGELTEKQIQKQNEIETVRSKISQILKSSNIEIVDENFGDEYDLDESDAQKQSQQDYDTLKALFGEKDRNKKDELTLTIDDFDYTYVGKYIEEFDLMHLKTIKHIKLKNPYAKKIKKALIAASLVVVVAVGAVCGFMFTKTEPVVLKSVTLSQNASYANFYEKDYFNFDGLKLKLEYSNGVREEKDLTYNHLILTEGGSVERIDAAETIQFLGGDVRMTFSYEGFNLLYNVEVKEKVLVGISARTADGIYSLKKDDYINAENQLVVLFEYDGFGFSKDGDLDNITINVDGIACGAYNADRKGWLVSADINKNSKIQIIYDSSNLEEPIIYNI